MNPVGFLQAVLLVSMPSFAMAAPPPVAMPVQDLTVGVNSYSVQCPPPGASSCVIRKPVSTGYRVLSSGVAMEDRGDLWIADFGKPAAGGSAPSRTKISILGARGDVHEIDVLFSRAPTGAGVAKPVVSKTPVTK